MLPEYAELNIRLIVRLLRAGEPPALPVEAVSHDMEHVLKTPLFV
jgi:hypothetical protein